MPKIIRSSGIAVNIAQAVTVAIPRDAGQDFCAFRQAFILCNHASNGGIDSKGLDRLDVQHSNFEADRRDTPPSACHKIAMIWASLICASVYLHGFIHNLLVHLAEKILIMQPLTFAAITRRLWSRRNHSG